MCMMQSDEGRIDRGRRRRALLRLGCDIHIVCEDDRPAIKFRLVCRLEFLHCSRIGVDGVCRLVLEDEDVDEACRVILLLPGRIDTRAWLTGADIG
jgi:hypothetical protein